MTGKRRTLGDSDDHNTGLVVVGVASPYAFDVVESAQRRGHHVTTIDNFGGASTDLPGLTLLADVADFDQPFTLGLSSAEHRAKLIEACSSSGFAEPYTLVDPTAVVASTTRLGHALYLNAGVVVGSNTTIGCASNINRSASLGHDNRLGFSVSVGPGAVLAGHVVCEDLVTVGAGATILPGVSIGRAALVGAGCVVTKDVQAGEVVVGNPARVVRHRSEVAPDIVCPYCEVG